MDAFVGLTLLPAPSYDGCCCLDSTRTVRDCDSRLFESVLGTLELPSLRGELEARRQAGTQLCSLVRTPFMRTSEVANFCAEIK